MLVKAIKSFCGKASMQTGQTADINNELAQRLLAAGYVCRVETTPPAPVEEKEKAKPIRKGRK